MSKSKLDKKLLLCWLESPKDISQYKYSAQQEQILKELENYELYSLNGNSLAVKTSKMRAVIHSTEKEYELVVDCIILETFDRFSFDVFSHKISKVIKEILSSEKRGEYFLVYAGKEDAILS